MSSTFHPNYPPTRYDLGYADEPRPGPRSAPPSVRVAALIGYLTGLTLVGIGVLAGMVTLGAGGSLAGDRSGLVYGYLREIGLAGGAVRVFAGLVVLVLARKLRRGRRWTRLLVVALSALTVGATLYTGLVGPGDTDALFGLVLPVVYLVLLYLPSARSWFRDRTY
jgi:hypothetical protein